MDVPLPALRLYHRIEPERIGAVIAAAAFLSLTLTLAPLLDETHLVEVTLAYLLLTLIVSALWGFRVGLVAAFLAVLLVNFFFVPPLHRLTVARVENAIGLGAFLTVAMVGATMLESLRRQVKVASARAAETRMLLDVSRALASGMSARDSLDNFCRAVTSALRVRGCSVIRDGAPLLVAGSAGGLTSLSRDEESVARAAMASNEPATLGGGKRDRADSVITFVPFGPVPERGVLRINGVARLPEGANAPGLLAAFAQEAMVALHRARLSEEAARVAGLERADEMKSILLSSVSHDLKSPLTAIKAAAQNLRDTSVGWSEEDRAAFLETIESQTDRLTATVTGLLEMSRLEGGAVRADLEPVEVSQLFADVVAQAERTAPGRRIVTRVAPGLWVSADYALMFQSLANLVENAHRYSQPEGCIFLEASPAPPVVRMVVRDEGPGISAEDLPHIFERFYRGAGSGTRGSGLGLAIVKAMVGLCGGTVAAQSPGTGAEFTIELPAARPPGTATRKT